MTNNASSEWSFSPPSLLRLAVRQVPVLRYALGVGGISAIISIVLLGWKLRPEYAAFGTLIVFAFMTIIIILSALSKISSANLRLPALVLTWSFLSLTLITSGLFVSCAFFNAPKTLSCLVDSARCPPPIQPGNARAAPDKTDLTEADRRVLDYMNQILALRGDFEAIDRNPTAPERVKVEGKRLADLIEGVDSKALTTPRKVIKYEYGGWAHLMVARAYPPLLGSGPRVEYARKALEAFNKALEEMDAVKQQRADGDAEASQVYEWMTSVASRDLDRTQYLKAIAIAVLAQSSVNGYSKETVRSQLKFVSDEYLDEFPARSVSQLEWASKD